MPTSQTVPSTTPTEAPSSPSTCTPRQTNRPPNCVVPWGSMVGVTDHGTITPSPWATDLAPTSTARVAVVSRERGVWLQFVALWGFPTMVGDWDVQETLSRGMEARPDGTILEMLESAYPDGLAHGYEVDRLFHLVCGVSDTPEHSWRSDEARDVLRRHLAALDTLELTNPDVGFAAMFVALAEVVRWRLGGLQRPDHAVAVMAVSSVVDGIKEADEDLELPWDAPAELSISVYHAAGPIAAPLL